MALVWRFCLCSVEQDTDVIMRDLLLQYTYPRLDDKVSININHLLKSPFCVHPKTRKSHADNRFCASNLPRAPDRVCVPINAETCEKFDPLAVPTLNKLYKELNEYDRKHPDKDRQIPGIATYSCWHIMCYSSPTFFIDMKKTSLKPYIEIFEKFVNALNLEVLKDRKGKPQNVKFMLTVIS